MAAAGECASHLYTDLAIPPIPHFRTPAYDIPLLAGRLSPACDSRPSLPRRLSVNTNRT